MSLATGNAGSCDFLFATSTRPVTGELARHVILRHTYIGLRRKHVKGHKKIRWSADLAARSSWQMLRCQRLRAILAITIGVRALFQYGALVLFQDKPVCGSRGKADLANAAIETSARFAKEFRDYRRQRCWEACAGTGHGERGQEETDAWAI